MKSLTLLLLLLASFPGRTQVESVSSGEPIQAQKFNEVIQELNNLKTQVSNLNNELQEAKTKVVPVGTVIIMPGACPSNYLETDGSSLLKSSYPALFAAIGTVHGSSDLNSFNIPDYRGLFLRMIDGTKGNDLDKASRVAMNPNGLGGNNIGSIQSDEVRSHNHGIPTPVNNSQSYSLASQSGYNQLGNTSHTGAEDNLKNTFNAGGTETRPKNAYVRYCIRAN